MTSSPQSEPAPPSDEVDRLRAENEQLRARLDGLEGSDHVDHRLGHLRSFSIGVLMVLITVTFVGGTLGVWARRSLLNDKVFAQRVVPLAQDPAVQAALSTRITNEVMTLVDPKALFEQVLPERGQILAAPLANAVKNFVGDQVANFVSSDAFNRLWTELVTRGHDAVLKILNGESEVVSAQGGAIVINLIPVINNVLARIGELSPEILGKTIDIPTLTADDIPEVARQKLAQVLGRDLPPEFGTIEIQGGGDQLAAAQQAVHLFNVLIWVDVIVFLLLVPLTLWISHRRRRTLLQLSVVLVLGTVLVRRLVMGLQAQVLSQVKIPANRPAVDAISSRFVNPLLGSTTVLLWLLAGVIAVALITGPYGWARRLREFTALVATTGGARIGSAAGRAADVRTIEWIRDHTGALQGAGVLVAVLILLLFDLSWFGVLLVLLAVGAYLAGLWWLTGGAGALAPAADAKPHGTPGPA